MAAITAPETIKDALRRRLQVFADAVEFLSILPSLAHSPRTESQSRTVSDGSNLIVADGCARFGNLPTGIERARQLGFTTTGSKSHLILIGRVRLERIRLVFMTSAARQLTSLH